MNKPRTDAIKTYRAERQGPGPVGQERKLSLSEYSNLLMLYSQERRQEGRNYAKSHSFEEWAAYKLAMRT